MLNKTQITDVLERALATYLQTVTGLLSAAQFGVGGIEDLSTLRACLVSAVPAGLSVIKGYLAVRIPLGDESASVLRVGYETKIVETVEVPAKKSPAKKTTATKRAPAKKTVR